VAELKNKLESELQFNIGTLQKSKGSNICFGSSNFMLLHINSLKYLCLYQDDNNNLLYAIVID
jgi:inositol 1,4,5-triphosphate receptor type 1